MPLPKIDEIRNLSDQELSDQIVAIKKQLFDLRFQKATRQLDKSHQFKHARHRLAQMLTVERERQLAASSDVKSAGSVAEEE
jgi:large subunit ribosomal protein L29